MNVSRRPTSDRIPVLLPVLVPVLLGLVATGVWSLLGSSARWVLTGPMPWAPTLLGLVGSLAVAVWLLAGRVARRRADAELGAALADQAARQRRLLGRLDHELKNPIQGIRTALADEPSERQRRSIETQSRRLATLLRDLRRIGELEQTELEAGPVDLTTLVEEAVSALAEQPGTAQRQVVVALPRAPRPLPIIRGDEDLLFLALTNVLGNAVKYSAAGDTVEVRGREEEGAVELEIADTGRGIPVDEVDLVWEELGRGREARGLPGSGLGLPLVRAIVERHGGRCALESWHGQGTTVTLRLPVAGAPGRDA